MADITCPTCLAKLEHLDDYAHGNRAHGWFGHAMFHTPEGRTALCIIPSNAQVAASVLGRKGGLAGKGSPARRAAAQKAIRARWARTKAGQ